MPLFLHEIKRNKLSLIIWTAAVCFMLGVALILYPEMKGQLNQMGDMFSEMGAFSEAFGMNNINFGVFTNYFAVECGNVLGLGGAFFASLTGVNALYTEQSRKTAEFLLTHPLSRAKVVLSKLLAVIFEITVFTVVNMAVSYLAVLAIGESISLKTVGLIFLAFFISQIVIAFISFGISAFLKSGGIGIAIGLSFGFYLVNIFANITESMNFLKYITPFSFCETTNIVLNGEITVKYLWPSLAFAVAGIVVAFLKYNKKDIS